MNRGWNVDPKSIGIGLLVGVCVMAARDRGPAEAPALPRYDVEALRDQNGNTILVILDHQTNRVHHPNLAVQLGGEGARVQDMISPR